MENPRIVVVGSCMIDLVSYAPRLPRAGETLTGQKFEQGFGGKGANQCVAAARLGGSTALIARLGDDAFGQEYIKVLKNEKISTEYVAITQANHTGMAQITVAASGENQIVIVPGANYLLSEDDVFSAKHVLEKADVLLFQLETPLGATHASLRLARGKGIRIVNAAPASVQVDPQLFAECDILCVNETEAEQLTSISVNCPSDATSAAKRFLELGCKTVVITLGSQGALLLSDSDHTPHHITAPRVKAVDTTGAGDAFVGAMAYYLAYHSDLPLEEIIRRACIVASFSVQRNGTQTSFPHRSNLPESLF